MTSRFERLEIPGRLVKAGERIPIETIPKSNVIATIGGCCLLIEGTGPDPTFIEFPLSMPHNTTAVGVYANNLAARIHADDRKSDPKPAMLTAYWISVNQIQEGWKLSAMAEVGNAGPGQPWDVCLGFNGYVTGEDK